MKALESAQRKLQNLVDIEYVDVETTVPDVLNELSAVAEELAENESELELLRKIEEERDKLQEELSEAQEKISELEGRADTLYTDFTTPNGEVIEIYCTKGNLADQQVFDQLNYLYTEKQLTPQQILSLLQQKTAPVQLPKQQQPAEVKTDTTAPLNELNNDKTEPMHITVELTAHPDLLSVLQTLANNVGGTAAASASKNGKSKPAATEKEDAPKPSQNGVPVPDDKVVSLEELRLAVKTKKEEGKMEAVKKLLSEFGADRLTNLEETQRGKFLTKVEAL